MCVFSFVIFVLRFYFRCCRETISLRSFLLRFCNPYSQFIHGRWRCPRKPAAQGRQLRVGRMPTALVKLWKAIIVALQSGFSQAGCSNRTVRPSARINLVTPRASRSLSRGSRYLHRWCKQYRELTQDSSRRRPKVEWTQPRGHQMLSTVVIRWFLLNVVLQSGTATGPLAPMRSETGNNTGLCDPSREVVKGRHPGSEAAAVRCARAIARISLTTPSGHQSMNLCGYAQLQQYQEITEVLNKRQQEKDAGLDIAFVDLYSLNPVELPVSRGTGGVHIFRQRRGDSLKEQKTNVREGAVKSDRVYRNVYCSAYARLCDLHRNELLYRVRSRQRRKDRVGSCRRWCSGCMCIGCMLNWRWCKVRRIGEADNPGPPKRPRPRYIPTMDRAMDGLIGHTVNRRQQQQQQQRQRRSEVPPKRARQTTRELRRETSASGGEYGREMDVFSRWWTQRDQRQDNGGDEDMTQAAQSAGEGAAAVYCAASSSSVAAAASSRRKRSNASQVLEVERSPTPVATQSKSKAQPKPKRSRNRSQPSPCTPTQTVIQPSLSPAPLGERQMSRSPHRGWRQAVEPEGGIPTPPAPQSPAHTICDSLPFEECESAAEIETRALRPSQQPTQSTRILLRDSQRPTQRSTPRTSPRTSPRPSPAPKQRPIGQARPLPKHGPGPAAGPQPPAQPGNFRRITARQPAQCRRCSSTITPRSVGYRCETCNDVVCSRDCRRAIAVRGCSCQALQQPTELFLDAAIPLEPTPAVPPTFSPIANPDNNDHQQDGDPEFAEDDYDEENHVETTVYVPEDMANQCALIGMKIVESPMPPLWHRVPPQLERRVCLVIQEALALHAEAESVASSFPGASNSAYAYSHGVFLHTCYACIMYKPIISPDAETPVEGENGISPEASEGG